MSELAEKFRDRFHGLERARGTYTITGRLPTGPKVQGRARTIHEPVTILVWKDHLDGKAGLGVVPIRDDSTCFFAALDIDIYDLDLVELERRVRRLKLPLVLFRTKSGGAHLYVFFSEPVPATIIRERLMEWAVALGYAGCEVFPKQVCLASEEDVGNWINMPYFGGDMSLRYAIREGKRLTMETFLEYASDMAVTEDELRQIVLPEDDFLKDGPPCLQVITSGGCPEGGRNATLFNLAIYLKKRYGPEQLDVRVAEANRTYMTPSVDQKELGSIVRSALNKGYGYTCKQEPLASHCSKMVCQKREFGVGGGTPDPDDPGVQFGQLVKCKTDPVVWVVQVNGVRMRMSTEDLYNQDRFRKKCMEYVDQVPNKMKGPKWDKFLNELLKNRLEQEAPPDAGPAGQMWAHLLDFCTQRAQARSKEEITLGKPWTEGGRTYFKSQALIRYLYQNHVRMTEADVWNVVNSNGGEHIVLQLGGRAEVCWSVTELKKRDESLQVPHKGNSEEF